MSGRYEDRMRRVLDHIHDNPADDLSLDALADVAAMSRYHWHRIFHAMTGETLAQAVRRIRLERAAFWLVQSDRTLARIARDVGYGSVPSFIRAFGEAYGVSPVRFRQGAASPMRRTEYSSGDDNMHELDIQTHPDRRLLALSHIGPYSDLGRSFQTLSAMITARGRWPDVEAMAAVYVDDPAAVPEAELQSWAAVAVGPDAPGEEGLDEVPLPGGRFAVLQYKGPYAGLAGAWQALYGTNLPASGLEPRDAPCFELYLNSPVDTAPEDLLTDICVPVE